MKLTHENVRGVLAAQPMTSREAAAFFPGYRHQDVAAVISTMRHLATPQVYILLWTRDADGMKTYLRAVYALGNRRDARKPAPLGNAERSARKRARRKSPAAPGTPNSVWQLGGLL